MAQAEAVFTVGEAFRGDHKAALAALSSTTTLQFEYLDALLRPGQAAAAGAAATNEGARGVAGRWGGGEGRGGGGGGGGGASSRDGQPQSRPLPALAAGLDDGDRSLHVRLLVRFRPYEVYPFLSNSTG